MFMLVRLTLAAPVAPVLVMVRAAADFLSVSRDTERLTVAVGEL